VLDRADAFIGVMIDDLVGRGTTEPYRMLTSRAEYRLVLRADNADRRLTPLGVALGCVSSERRRAFEAKNTAIAAVEALLRQRAMTPPALRRHGWSINDDGVPRSGFDLLRYPDASVTRLAALWPDLADVPADVAEQVEIDARYAGYLERQEADIRAFRKDESLALPADLDYSAVGSLSHEVRTKLAAARPTTLGAASRISGVTPAALVALLRHVKRQPPRSSAA
jgi:tRNA uridine 5-carboxymethylaminomethyl modification enzyme